MLLTDAELDTLVQHLRAQRPTDEALSSVLKKAETSLIQRRNEAKGLGKKPSAAQLQTIAAASETPINRFFNPGVPTGYSPPRRCKEGSILKQGLSETIDASDPLAVLEALGL